jgi:hypothetical protein
VAPSNINLFNGLQVIHGFLTPWGGLTMVRAVSGAAENFDWFSRHLAGMTR